MKKIMFNDKYGLTEAVLTGRKTQTRRIADQLLCYMLNLDAMADKKEIINSSRYKIGEVVAIAQSYSALNVPVFIFGKEKGWNNKMFVKASLMPHHIKITNVRVERLQDISDEDCMREGIIFHPNDSPDIYYFFDKKSSLWNGFNSAKKAYATLIDEIEKKGTWDSNPWVFVYDFKLIN